MTTRTRDPMPHECATDVECAKLHALLDATRGTHREIEELIERILNRSEYFQAILMQHDEADAKLDETFSRAVAAGESGAMSASAGTIDDGRPFMLVVGVGDGAQTLHEAVRAVAALHRLPPDNDPPSIDTPNRKGPGQ